jgi:hypothetical protein
MPLLPETSRTPSEEDECRCDCVSCVSGDHMGCYYEGLYPDTGSGYECPIKERVVRSVDMPQERENGS